MKTMRTFFRCSILLVLLAACTASQVTQSPLSPVSPPQSPTLAPTASSTPKPTLTPLPPATARPSPTPTLRPTATPIPTLAIPDEAIVLDHWAELPASLYFIREGSLWRWPKGGGELEEVVAAPEQTQAACGKLCRPVAGPGPLGVIDYRVTPDEQNVVFVYYEAELLEDGSHRLHTYLRVLNHIFRLLSKERGNRRALILQILLLGQTLSFYK